MPKSDNGVGLRLKAARKAFDMSQRKLARRAGVANATISQIESGDLNPTVGVLKKILTGLPMSLSEFFSDDDISAREQVFFRARELMKISDGGISYRQVGRDLSDKTIQLLHERYEPGATTGRHALKHEGEETGLVLKGALTVTIDGQTEVLRAGDAYYFNSTLPHSFRNDGDIICELVTACSPPTF